jgi:protein-L-isoaspartate(D-aspartate) O-methyltransferase
MDFQSLRKQMVERHIAARGVRDELVLDAMRKVPRELFLPDNLREFAYEDAPLPIAEEQTISQPYIVAFMVEALLLKGGEKVLEIGSVGDRRRCLHRGAARPAGRAGGNSSCRTRL